MPGWASSWMDVVHRYPYPSALLGISLFFILVERLLPVRIDGPLPDPNTPLLAGEREIAVMRSGQGDRGLALVRLDRLAEAGGLGRNLSAGEAIITLSKPDWADYELSEPGA